MKPPPPAYIVDRLTYDPETGVFRWLHPAPGRRPDGVAGSKLAIGYIHISFESKFYYAHRLAVLFMTGRMPLDQGTISTASRTITGGLICVSALSSRMPRTSRLLRPESTTFRLALVTTGAGFMLRYERMALSITSEPTERRKRRIRHICKPRPDGIHSSQPLEPPNSTQPRNYLCVSPPYHNGHPGC